MIRNMIIMLAIVGVVFGGIMGYHAFSAQMVKQYLASMGAAPVTVSSIKAQYQNWQPTINAVGSLRAIRGVDLSSEMSGVVKEVLFTSGDEVTQGQVLLKINDDAEQAQLRSLKIDAALAKTILERDQKQLEAQAISQAVVDSDKASVEGKEAMVIAQQALIAKKTITAPFGGKLGISSINVGQYLNPGDKIVTLQNLDKIYVDFFVPQQELSTIAVGQSLKVTVDTFPNVEFEGKISALNPKIETDSRNVQVEAIVDNPKHQLIPGMFVTIKVQAGEEQKYITLPQSAVSFNPYGETVYIIEDKGKSKDGKPNLTVKQSFITTSLTRGDQVAVVKGVKEGDLIVSMGAHKLRNGNNVLINNDVLPSNEAAPITHDE